MLTPREHRLKRAQRVRRSLTRKSSGRPRLCIFRSSKHIYAQVIDDLAGRTVVAASSIDKELRADLAKGGDRAAAAAVGKLVATRAQAAGVTEVVFDRGGYQYHGRVKALADAAREAGLSF